MLSRLTHDCITLIIQPKRLVPTLQKFCCLEKACLAQRIEDLDKSFLVLAPNLDEALQDGDRTQSVYCVSSLVRKVFIDKLIILTDAVLRELREFKLLLLAV